MRGIALAAALVLFCTGVSAHHSHPDFSLDQEVTVAGTLENNDWQLGHVVLTLRAADSTLYSAEWQGSNWLYNHTECLRSAGGPVARDTLKIGDVITVVGAPAKDPARHELVVLKEVRRARDQWHWAC